MDVRYDLAVNQKAITQFIANAIGGDYLMVHDNHAYWMGTKVRNFLLKNLELVKVQFPGHARSQLDILMRSAGLSQIRVQIRAERGSYTFPTRLQCSYATNTDALSKITQVYEV